MCLYVSLYVCAYVCACVCVWCCVSVCVLVLLKLAELCSGQDIHLTLGYLLELRKVRSDVRACMIQFRC